jgi:diguanylate cyclase (GGDEF)-like protein
MDDEVSQRQNALEHQALHDHLTGLPNRFMLNQRIQYQLLSSERVSQPFTLFLMDLDHFKDINDTLGHSAGDCLLIEMAQRINSLVRKSDTVARLGGDEFAILLPDSDHKTSVKLATAISESISKPFHLNEHKVNVTVSIGIVSYPDDGDDAMGLLQHADMAMYVAKRRRSRFAHYEADQDFYSSERLELINDLQNALKKNQLELYYQPKIDTVCEKITGAEALLRWRHDKFGYVPPDKIIELAEHIGIIHKLSLWVLEEAISRCGQWHKKGQALSIAVNLSVRDLSNPGLCDQVAKLLEENQLASEFLTLEITESVMMENLALSIEILNRLNHMGINISIDDFGTGFSSLAYLKRLPVKELKIDKSFVMDMDTDESDEVIVQSTINLGHNLGLKVVAEGIESRHVMDMVKKLGCDSLQGYFFGKPQNGEDFDAMLQQKSVFS